MQALRQSNVKVVLKNPGPIATSMTEVITGSLLAPLLCFASQLETVQTSKAAIFETKMMTDTMQYACGCMCTRVHKNLHGYYLVAAGLYSSLDMF